VPAACHGIGYGARRVSYHVAISACAGCYGGRRQVERYLKRLDDDLARYETTLQTKLDVDAMKASRRRRRAEDQELRRARKAKVEEEPARTLGQSMFASVAGEETYCICKRVSFGQMIACDDPHCKIEWYHIGCVGLKTIPSGKWYCPQCLTRRKR